jgi:D-glycero-alpha-D-manno-heptose-7-phosphate kinase
MAVLDAYRNRDPAVVNALRSMREIAERQADALAAANIDLLASLVEQQWTHQRSLHPAIPTERIDDIIAHAKAAGAIGSKALGASGGGCVLVIAAANRVTQVRAAVEPFGELLSFTVAKDGVERCA